MQPIITKCEVFGDTAGEDVKWTTENSSVCTNAPDADTIPL